jgi:quercetin dioxygenase-like cupin family protein
MATISKAGVMKDRTKSGGMTPPRAALVQGCRDLEETIAFFRQELGFRLETIFPADDPTVAVISGHGLRIRLQLGTDILPATLWLPRSARLSSSPSPDEIVAPNGTRVLFAESDAPTGLEPTAPELVIRRRGEIPGHDDWIEGRAGMRYRDLIPGRWNGHIIASHIQIPLGGPVPDYVHYHDVRFQMIYCHRGWVRVVYEDQGPPFVMNPGDCVLQPPGIRHQVLEASDGLEVIEIGCPALHATHADHDLLLPSSRIVADRIFAGQLFTRHVAARASWEPQTMSRTPREVLGFEVRDLGIAAATSGLASATVTRMNTSATTKTLEHPGGFQFIFVLDGDVTLSIESTGEHRLGVGDAATIPPGSRASLCHHAGKTEILEVTVSADAFSR